MSTPCKQTALEKTISILDENITIKINHNFSETQAKQTILAIETCSPALSVALLHDHLFYEANISAPRKHAALLLPIIDTLFQEANIQLKDCSALACCIGPGTFTGIRIGTSVIKGLAWSNDLPVIPVNTLEALADAAKEHSIEKSYKQITSVIDARMDAVYHASYAVKDLDCITPPSLTPINEAATLFKSQQNTLFVGSGLSTYQTAFNLAPEHVLETLLYPGANYIIRCAIDAINHKQPLLSADQLEPLYLRDQVTD